MVVIGFPFRDLVTFVLAIVLRTLTYTHKGTQEETLAEFH